MNNFFIEKRVRENLGTGRKIYNIVFGVLFAFISGNNIWEKGFSTNSSLLFIYAFLFIASILILIFGIIGKEPIKTRYRLIINNEHLRIKKTFEFEIKVKLSSITHLKFFSQRLEITHHDFIKTYDLSWLSEKDFERLVTWLTDYCRANRIAIN